MGGADATVVGAYGSIIDTLRHIISWEASDVVRLAGGQPRWDYRAEDAADLDELSRRVDELEGHWERFLETPFDAERTFLIPWHDGGARDVPAGIFLIGALHHAIEHRSQICTILTTIGITRPTMAAASAPGTTPRPPTALRSDWYSCDEKLNRPASESQPRRVYSCQRLRHAR